MITSEKTIALAGYIPVLIADCISSRNPFDRDIAIKRARGKGVIVSTLEARLF